MRPLGENLGAGCRLDGGHGGGMIAMRMRDENVRHGLTAHGVEQRSDVSRIVGSGIDDRDLAASDDVTHCPFEGERTRIVGDDTAHTRRKLFGAAGSELEYSVIWNVVGHCAAFAIWMARNRLDHDRNVKPCVAVEAEICRIETNRERTMRCVRGLMLALCALLLGDLTSATAQT